MTVDLDRLPRATQALTAHDRKVSCEGVLLRDVLAKAGLPTGADVRGTALTTVITAHARDGYRVAFTLGELDAQLGAARVLVATRCDDHALDEDDGPLRLVVDDRTRGARSVRQLERLSVDH